MNLSAPIGAAIVKGRPRPDAPPLRATVQPPCVVCGRLPRIAGHHVCELHHGANGRCGRCGFERAASGEQPRFRRRAFAAQKGRLP